MTSALSTFAFDSKEIRVTDQNGDSWFILRDLLDAMESKTTTTAAVESIKQGLGEGFVGDIPLQTAGGTQAAIVIAESAATYLLSRSNTNTGRELNRFIHIEILPSIRKHGRYAVTNQPEQGPTLPELMIAEAAARMLRMSDTSKLRMLTGICDMHGVSSAFLPSYVDEPLVSAPTALLKKLGAGMSAKAFNLALIDMGVLEELERVGSKGQIKRFKSLTAEGLKYGRNETSQQNPRETQPLYFVDQFPALLDQVHAHLSMEEVA